MSTSQPPHESAGRSRAQSAAGPAAGPSSAVPAGRPSGGRRTAGALGIRNLIGLLLAVYGVILTAAGLFGDPETDKTAGVNANLWGGVVLVLAGLIFMAWARLRPVVVPQALGAGPREQLPPAG